jgi:hypothetical protein
LIVAFICFFLFSFAAHRYAFPYSQYHPTKNNTTLGTSLLNDNFATSDLLRDVNESGMKVVLPTGFTPSSKDVVASEEQEEEEEEEEEEKKTTTLDSSYSSVGEEKRGGGQLDAKVMEYDDEEDAGWRM